MPDTRIGLRSRVRPGTTGGWCDTRRAAILGETITPVQIVGAALVLAGVLLVSLKAEAAAR